MLRRSRVRYGERQVHVRLPALRDRYAGGTSNTLTLTGGSILDFNGGVKGNNTHWTLIADEGVVKLLGNIAVTARDVATLNYDRIQKDFDRLLKSTSITRTPYDVGRLLTGKAYAEREERREKRRKKEARK